MASYNKAILIGNLTKDVELRYTPQGTAVANITLAINRQWKQGDEVKKEVAFVPVVLWARTAEIVNQYCSKGAPLMVEGRVQTRSWEKDGQKQYKTEIVAENIQLLGGNKKEGAPQVAKGEPLVTEDAPADGWLVEEDGAEANA
ncbi:MAG: single-stranded DNA-binding protein [Nanoarchaeota archaeon]